jgi:hypothetical protein
MNELTHNQLKKKEHNLRTYTLHKNTYKVSYIFKKYPYIPTNHSVQIAEYLRTHDERVDDDFIAFLRTFIIPNDRPTKYNVKPKQNVLPRVLTRILKDTTNLPITI